MFAIVASFAGAATQSYVPASDVTIVGISAVRYSAGQTNFTVSSDQNATPTNPFNTAGVYSGYFSWLTAAGSSSSVFIPLSTPALEGETIFFSADASGILTVYFEPAVLDHVV